MTGSRARRGALIPVVLVVMVIIALAACAALFAARQDRRASWNSRLQTSALGAADHAHAAAVSTFATVAPTLGAGSSVTRSQSIGDGIDATLHLTRLGPTLFSLLVDGGAHSAQGVQARRRAALLLRLDPPSLRFPAALNIVGGSPPDPAVVDGDDRVPAEWPCDEVGAASAMRHPSPAPDTSVLAALRARASITLPSGATMRAIQPGVRDGACLTERPDNWGDPDRVGPCAGWLPVVHATGDLTIDGGAGQGLLLVDGNLMIAGGFRFVGAMVVAGTLGVGRGGATIVGGVTADGVNGSSGGAGPVIHRSTCAAEAALVAAGVLLPVADRAWTSIR
jgi:hypothetical protein